MKHLIIFFLSISLCYATEDIEKLLKEECTYPYIAIAIMNHESAYGKSTLATKYNNLFGFKGGKYASGRTKSGYSTYSSKERSAMAYIYFESRIINKFKISSREQYLNVLNSLYASDPNWKQKILRHVSAYRRINQ